ncbi:MAG TPA: hypothetical protein P5317_11630 [Myxococcota bacterium]|mgnify:CR=1 FL=1|nr:hypothetical protein [Myxococcota bacterium]HRV18644.1 hypothetical protein [Myxococcota bacterium]
MSAKSLLESALQVINTSPDAAAQLIKAALAELGEPQTGTQTAGVVAPTSERAVVYGKDGYTDANDPRQPNARNHINEGGKVMGMWLTVHVKPETKYRCVNAYVIDEVQAKGQTVIFVDVRRKDGTVANEVVLMATGYKGQDWPFDELLEPGQAFRPVQHIMADEHTGKGCSFNPPDLGPLAVFVAGPDRKPISDVIGDLGLPGSHHISVFIELHER